LRRMEINEGLENLNDAAADAELARSIATESGNVDHAVRATVWLAIYAQQTGADGAMDKLRGALDAAVAAGAALRPPTKKLIDKARSLLPSS
jgi:hypothetical protein